jgi:hypothetical protein
MLVGNAAPAYPNNDYHSGDSIIRTLLHVLAYNISRVQPKVFLSHLHSNSDLQVEYLKIIITTTHSTHRSFPPNKMAPHAEEPKPDSGVDLISHDGTVYGDWRDEFHKNGTAIIKGAITPERAEYYKQKQIEWLQSFGRGFDPNDESTWTQEHLPVSFKGGMYFAYSSTHEKFVW